MFDSIAVYATLGMYLGLIVLFVLDACFPLLILVLNYFQKEFSCSSDYLTFFVFRPRPGPMRSRLNIGYYNFKQTYPKNFLRNQVAIIKKQVCTEKRDRTFLLVIRYPKFSYSISDV